jgi:serine/threonine protein kinase
MSKSRHNEAQIPSTIGPYQLLGTIGSGSYATVKLAYRKDLDIYYACKIIAKSRLTSRSDQGLFEREIRILQQLRHPRITQLYDLFQDDKNYYILMEYCPNGELFTHIVSSKYLSEAEARVYFIEMCEGLQFVHSQNVAHRDLKPENTLLDANGHCKLSDFGLARFVGPSGLASTSCGTPCYVSPEILSGRSYDAKKSDIWSLGVVLFAMLTGQLPWSQKNQAQLFQQIRSGYVRMPSIVQPSAASLIRSMLVVNCQARLDVKGVLDHPWTRATSIPQAVPCETPFVSLRRLDRFFGQDEDRRSVVSLRRRPYSVKLRKGFWEEGCRLVGREKAKSLRKDMTVKSSQTNRDVWNH